MCVCVCVCRPMFAVDTVPTVIDPALLLLFPDSEFTAYPRYPMTRSRAAVERARGPRNPVNGLRVHDYVWLATTHLVLPGSPHIQLPRYIGPFRVTGMIGDTEVVLYIPGELKMKRCTWDVQDVVFCQGVHTASDFHHDFPVSELVSG